MVPSCRVATTAAPEARKAITLCVTLMGSTVPGSQATAFPLSPQSCEGFRVVFSFLFSSSLLFFSFLFVSLCLAFFLIFVFTALVFLNYVYVFSFCFLFGCFSSVSFSLFYFPKQFTVGVLNSFLRCVRLVYPCVRGGVRLLDSVSLHLSPNSFASQLCQCPSCVSHSCVTGGARLPGPCGLCSGSRTAGGAPVFVCRIWREVVGI